MRDGRAVPRSPDRAALGHRTPRALAGQPSRATCHVASPRVALYGALPRLTLHCHVPSGTRQVDAAIKEHDSAVDRLLAVKEKDIMQL